MLNGGYLMVSKNDTKLYEKLNNALTLGKPVLFYENDTTCYYIDTIALDGTDIVLTKGGKTITVEEDGDITETGDIQNHLYVVTFTSGDFQVSMFAKKKLNNYNVDDMTTLTATDIEYLKSLKDALYDNQDTPIGVLYGADASGISLSHLSGIHNSTLYLDIDGYDYEVDLDNPANQTTGSGLDIKFLQLI